MSINTYRAVQAVAPGRLELTRKPLRSPGAGQVRIRVEACGVCHSDAVTIEGIFHIDWPRVPGHEVIGRIDAVGDGVLGWNIGQRVGVGFLAGPCQYCEPCRGGDLVNCRNQAYTGVQQDGGYAEVLLTKATGLMAIPDELASVDAAPLLCAGLTTFSALRNSDARAGDLVAVVGIGGLGHLAVQYARHMGFEVVAIGRGADKAVLAKELGAHHFIDSTAQDVAAGLVALGGAALVVVTSSGGDAVAQTISGLRPRGTVLTLGASGEPLGANATQLIFGNHRLAGALTGDPATGDATLRFSVLAGVGARVESMPLERAADAYARMMAGKARFRIVLTMGS